MKILFPLLLTSTMLSAQGIDLFKPFQWNDNIYTIIQKVKDMPGITTATLECGSSNDNNILNITDIQDHLKKSLSKEKANDGDYGTESEEKKEYYTDLNGNKKEFNDMICNINAEPIMIDNAEYTLEISLRSDPAGAALYPNNVIVVDNVDFPFYIYDLKLEAKDRSAKNVINSPVSMQIVNKYKNLKPMAKKVNGILMDVTITDKNGHEIELYNNLSISKTSLVSGYVHYMVEEQYMKDYYQDSIAKYTKTKVNLKNNF